MTIGVVGVSHQGANLAQREQAARSIPLRPGAVPLVTCGRVELYVSGEAPGWSADYAHQGIACLRHLARVTAGLESALRGEADIQGQVKRAYLEATARGPLPAPLHQLFQKSLQLGKELRSRMPLYQATPCYGPTVVAHLQAHFPTGGRILVVGSSQINRRIIDAAMAAGYQQISWCTRAPAEAPPGGHVPLLGFDALNRWEEYDVLICATRCPHLLIEGRAAPNPAPKLLIDLSVPRNIDPQLGTIPRWTLLGLDVLHAQMAHLLPPQAAWEQAEAYLDVRIEQAYALLQRRFIPQTV